MKKKINLECQDIFVKLGSTENYSDLNNPIIFQPQSFKSSVNYSEMNTIGNHLKGSYSDVYKKKIENIKHAFVTFGSTWKNIHLYYKDDSKKLDPNTRICYISNIIENGDLIIKEHNDSRGAKYSGLYRLLLKRIQETGKFAIKRNQFNVNGDNIDTFVEVINLLLTDYEDGELNSFVYDEMYKIKFTNEEDNHFYNKVYWAENTESDDLESKDEESEQEVLSDEDAILAFESIIKTKCIGKNSNNKKYAINKIKHILYELM